MAGLGDMADRLKQQLQGHTIGAGPAGRMAEVRNFGANPGGLGMLVYTPQGLPAGAPLVVVLHGCTQAAEAHASAAGWLTLADRYGFMVLAPEQASANNPNRCFNWFEPADAARGAGEAASIRAMVAHCITAHGLDTARVFVTGLSAGGAMAAVMLATYPEVFAAGAVIAGLPFGAARGVQEAMTLMHGPRELSGAQLGALVHAAAPASGRFPRISVWHGDLDRTVNHRNGADTARQWAAAHGLAAEPTEVEATPGLVRSIWRSPDGEALIESNLVIGLGHGTPLAAAGEHGIGAPAPFMLEAGISSSLEIARFWGLVPAGIASMPTGEGAAAPTPEPPPQPQTPADVGQAVMAALSGYVSPDVQATINRALKNAGLMR